MTNPFYAVGVAKSSRTPGKPKTSNLADIIEVCMQQDKHQTWGLVIYRCTYASSSDWDIFLASFKSHIKKDLAYYNGHDIYEKLEVTVIEDPVELDGASTAVVREKFREWSAAEDVDDWVQCQRLRYCIQVDEASLQSVLLAVAKPEESFVEGMPYGGFVNVIRKKWEPYDPTFDQEEPEEPLEGVTLRDVGWMRVGLEFLVSNYCDLRMDHVWEPEYRRPPAVARS